MPARCKKCKEELIVLRGDAVNLLGLARHQLIWWCWYCRKALEIKEIEFK